MHQNFTQSHLHIYPQSYASPTKIVPFSDNQAPICGHQMSKPPLSSHIHVCNPVIVAIGTKKNHQN